LGKWVPLIVPRICNDLLDCMGKGSAKGLPGSCVCTCLLGYAGTQCESCDVGYEGYPECRTQRRISDGWRIQALEVPHGKTWHVADVTFHTDFECSSESQVRKSIIQQYIGSYDGTGDGDLALGPERAFDSEGVSTTWISSRCSDNEVQNCPNGAPWIGVRLSDAKAVVCVRIYQGHTDFAVDSVALDLWNGTGIDGGYWHRVRSWTGVLQERVIEGTAMSGYSSLRLVCNDGLPTGNELMHNCDTEKQPWESCQAWCREGYSGPMQTFLCGDDFAFRGILPACDPKECTSGIPAGEGVSVDDCLGKTTGERCQASCGSGYVGSEVNYVCGTDGSWREERTSQFGVSPACLEGIAALEVTSSWAMPQVLRPFFLCSSLMVIMGIV